MKRHGKNKQMLLTERSKSENSTYCVIPTLWHSKKDKSMKTIKKKKDQWLPGIRRREK